MGDLDSNISLTSSVSSSKTKSCENLLPADDVDVEAPHQQSSNQVCHVLTALLLGHCPFAS